MVEVHIDVRAESDHGAVQLVSAVKREFVRAVSVPSAGMAGCRLPDHGSVSCGKGAAEFRLSRVCLRNGGGARPAGGEG